MQNNQPTTNTTNHQINCFNSTKQNNNIPQSTAQNKLKQNNPNNFKTHTKTRPNNTIQKHQNKSRQTTTTNSNQIKLTAYNNKTANHNKLQQNKNTD
jgi:hypothetical protein